MRIVCPQKSQFYFLFNVEDMFIEHAELQFYEYVKFLCILWFENFLLVNSLFSKRSKLYVQSNWFCICKENRLVTKPPIIIKTHLLVWVNDEQNGALIVLQCGPRHNLLKKRRKEIRILPNIYFYPHLCNNIGIALHNWQWEPLFSLRCRCYVIQQRDFEGGHR
jgi:hypothetical protein